MSRGGGSHSMDRVTPRLSPSSTRGCRAPRRRLGCCAGCRSWCKDGSRVQRGCRVLRGCTWGAGRSGGAKGVQGAQGPVQSRCALHSKGWLQGCWVHGGCRMGTGQAPETHISGGLQYQGGPLHLGEGDSGGDTPCATPQAGCSVMLRGCCRDCAEEVEQGETAGRTGHDSTRGGTSQKPSQLPPHFPGSQGHPTASLAAGVEFAGLGRGP